MDKGHNFWRRLGVVGMLIGGVLFLAFFLAYRSTRQAEAMKRWLNHTPEALSVIARARLEHAWLQTEYWTYRSSRSQDLPPRLQSDLRALGEERLANRIEIARDDAEALDFLFCRGAYSGRSFEKPPRLVLLDLKLPRVSGHDVLRAIKAGEGTSAIPVVLLTSSDQESDLGECHKRGVNSYIQKPVDLQKFQETVRQFGRYGLIVNHMPPNSTFIAKESGGQR